METRTALVTGAAQGLGQEFAVALAGRGYRVAGLDLVPQPETAEKVLDYAELIGDITDEAQIRPALDRLIGQFGTLHVLVNNAGVYPSRPFEEITPEEWRRVMRVNLEAPFLLTRAVLPYLKAAGQGRVVNIVSAAVLTAPPTMVPYVASKMGLIGFTRSLAAALGPYDITVNAIAPSMVRTATAERTVGADGGFEHVRDQQVVPRTQQPFDLVSTLLYVVDEGSGFLTGQTLNVSGGSAYL
ncbi:3-oxoacyl-[acyl-carrier protein] reductase [Streptomyces sp. 3213]|uniref:SDR family NAD(P)-dependent oxidoreductase n=1 Tax=Streptomyces sp. 3213.3 TaxID=1855348 RepID=UPI00089D5EFE|nr:SDR family oxidoreductase [Streptomyces sp. 3213.3]SEE81228.1 3-oxoacyl-[acyl-carrier protein] reductase [Streptomyces sp. 3213] [Streptomyces sp. 3213.3]